MAAFGLRARTLGAVSGPDVLSSNRAGSRSSSTADSAIGGIIALGKSAAPLIRIVGAVLHIVAFRVSL
jgi:hypothetical protein